VSDKQPTRRRAFIDGVADGFKAAANVLSRGAGLSVLGPLIEIVVAEPPRRDRTIGEVIEALQDASTLVQELEADLQERTNELVRLQERHDSLTRLTAVEEEEARALLGEVEASVGRGRRRDYLVALLINVLTGAVFFALGLWVGAE
jgi:hypothetical protein